MLRIERDARGIVTLTLDRARGAKCACPLSSSRRLTEALASLAGDPSVRVVLLTGVGQRVLRRR